MLKISDLINKFKKTATPVETGQSQNVGDERSAKKVRNWYEERYDNITVQRNSIICTITDSIMFINYFDYCCSLCS